jgi:hypothetical protein
MEETKIIATLQEALAKHLWRLHDTVGDTISARCSCGADVRTTSTWLEHIKNDVIPESVRSLGLK